ncbi:SpoIID/LytB domain-containing protein [bacterium]|nr:MAG: SpoIID/LytB domain-containing protein [bacterium]
MVTSIKQKLILSLAAIITLAFNFRPLAGNCYEPSGGYVRVAIIRDAPTLNLVIGGFYEVSNPLNRSLLYRGRNLRTTVTAYKGGISIGRMNFNLRKIYLEADNISAILINGRRFNGDIELIKDEKSRLCVVNYLELEDYIKGVLYNETSHYWPIEALKAQAVISRSFAVFKMQESRARDYDLTSDIYSQVYGGKASERQRTNLAVDQTKGLVITYRGDLFPAYYHATCGGHTENSAELWQTDILPLKGVACSFCKESPHFNWHLVVPLEEIEEKLTAAGYKISKLKNITILKRNASGRVSELNFSSDAKDLKILAKDFRNILGPNIIKSTNFNLSLVNHDVVFEGLGWGHGVGLCQWGAYFMAKQGYSYEQILKYYYPGTDVKAL